jgi:hypothetical protein
MAKKKYTATYLDTNNDQQTINIECTHESALDELLVAQATDFQSLVRWDRYEDPALQSE